MNISSKTVAAAIIIVSFLFLACATESFCIQNTPKKEDVKCVQLLSDCMGIIKKEYVEEPKDTNLVYGALRGMLSSLDQHSQFLDPDEYADLKAETTGQFGGLGIEITIKDGLLTIVTPLADTPAWKAGLKPQDRIVKIDGLITRNISMSDAVKKLRGQPGSTVNLTVLRESSRSVFDVNIKRAVIRINGVKTAVMIEPGIAYIRITEFGEKTLIELENALSRFKEEGMKTLILDLRNNPGGLLTTAISITEKFLPPKKLIVSTKGREPSNNTSYFSNAHSPLVDIPMVILVNEGSASGSEILAGALKDYKRAVIVGKKTFGKGSVQTVIPLSDGSAMKLTTSIYFTPSGESIHNTGITPDVEINETDYLSGEIKETDKKEDLKDIFEGLEPVVKTEAPAASNAQDLKNDTQLMRAVDILKAISVYANQPDAKSK